MLAAAGILVLLLVSSLLQPNPISKCPSNGESLSTAVTFPLSLLSSPALAEESKDSKPAADKDQDSAQDGKAANKDKPAKQPADAKARAKDEQPDKPDESAGSLTLPLLPPTEEQAADGSGVLASGVTVTSAAKSSESDAAQSKAEADVPADRRAELAARQSGLSLGADAGKGKTAPALENDKVPVKATEQPQATKPKPAPAKQAQPKPAAGGKPAAKPKPAAAPQQDLTKDLPAPPAAESLQPELPAAEQAATTEPIGPRQPDVNQAGASAKTLSEYFSEDELADPASDSALLADTQQAEAPGSPAETGNQLIAVIPTGGQQTAADDGVKKPTLGQVLSGEARDARLGENLAGISPWRSLAVILGCLGLLFVAMWAAGKLKRPLASLRQQSMKVLETVSIGAGRQILIVEMNEEALVLGVTPHSINLLDKMPLEQMGASYGRTVNAIIARESTSKPADWAKRPGFSQATAQTSPLPSMAPPLATPAYGPSGRPRSSVSELRSARASSSASARTVLTPARSMPNPPRTAAAPARPPVLQAPGAGPGWHASPARGSGSDERTKAELISRIREQLRQLEK